MEVTGEEGWDKEVRLEWSAGSRVWEQLGEEILDRIWEKGLCGEVRLRVLGRGFEGSSLREGLGLVWVVLLGWVFGTLS